MAFYYLDHHTILIGAGFGVVICYLVFLIIDILFLRP